MKRPLDERLSAYLDGELEAPEQDALQAELRERPGTATDLESLRALECALAELPRIEPERGFEARFRARLERELVPRRVSWRERLRERLAGRTLWLGAGGLAGAAAAAALALWLGGRSEPLGPELEQVAEITDAETWELLRSGDVELLEVLEILEAWDGVRNS